MKFLADSLVWVFVLMGLLRIVIILRKREVPLIEYKNWAKRIAFIIVWFFGIYGLIAFSKVTTVTEVLTDRYAWVAASEMGLWLREEPSQNAEVVQGDLFDYETFMPNGLRVVILEKGLNPEKIDGQEGAWCKVEYNGYQGYCFDGWLLKESALLELAKSYSTYLGEENKKKAFDLQTRWSDSDEFASPSRFGGITETKIISSTFQSISGEKTATVQVVYQAIDPINDEQTKSSLGLNCQSAGIVFKMNFLIKKWPSGVLKIADFTLVDTQCPE